MIYDTVRLTGGFLRSKERQAAATMMYDDEERTTPQQMTTNKSDRDVISYNDFETTSVLL
jgi:hypothetical protein